MTEPDGKYGEEIRHALSAVADLVVPAGDGLAKIRQRTRHRPPALAWFYAYATYLPRVLIVSFRVPASELALMAKGQSTLLKRVWTGLRRQFKPGSPHTWLRPALAAGGAVVMVIAVMLAVPGLRETVNPSAMNSSSTNSGSGGGKGSRGSEQVTGASQRAPTPSGSGSMNITVAPSSTRCPGQSSPASGSGGSSTYIPPVGSTPTESAGMAGDIAGAGADTTLHNGAKSQNDALDSSRCAKSHSTSSGGPTSSGSPTSSSSPTGSSSPTSNPTISPTGGGTPTPTSTAITDTPTPNESDTGGMNP